MGKRVLIFSLAYYPHHVSGAEAAVRETTDRIDDISFECITLLFDTKKPKVEQIGNVLVRRVGLGSRYLSKILFIPLATWTAYRLHRAKPYDGLWVIMTYMLFPVLLLRLLGVRLPYVLTLQDGDPYEKVFERWFIRPVAPLLDVGFKNATVIHAISQYLATWPKLRGSSAPVEVIYNGANPGDLAMDLRSDEKETLRKELGVQSDDVLLMTASRLEHKNAVDDVIRALPLLPDHVRFLVVGGGAEEERLKALARDLGVTARVVFTGQVARTEVPKYRHVSDIFVRPSRSEGLGNALLSAMAARLPVIATQEGGLAEFIFDAKRNPEKGTTGWAVDKDSPREIAEAVQCILNDPENTQKVVATAFDMVSKTFQWEYIAKDMREKVFARLF